MTPTPQPTPHGMTKPLFREWARKLTARKGVMVSTVGMETILKGHDPGYGSVYAFDEEASQTIREQASSRGFDRFTPYADSLTIDIDGGDTDLVKAKERLVGYSYEVWASGGKGYHIVIQHELIGDINLPYSQRRWVEAMGIPADLTLYQPGRIVSLPGRVHPKTKVKKRLVETVVGHLTLTIPILAQPDRWQPKEVTDQTHLFALAIERVAYLALNEPTPGNRHQRLWGTAKDLCEIGIGYEAALELLLGVNNTWQNSKEEAEIIRAVQDGYKIRGLSRSISNG